MSYATPRGPAALEQNRAAGLIAFGVITIIAAAGVLTIGIMGMAMMITGVMVRPSGASRHEMLHVAGMLLMMASVTGLMLWLGIGSIRRRRWARPLTLATAWLWLASGTVGAVTFAIGNVIVPVVGTVTSATTVFPATTTAATSPATQPATPPVTVPAGVTTATATIIGVVTFAIGNVISPVVGTTTTVILSTTTNTSATSPVTQPATTSATTPVTRPAVTAPATAPAGITTTTTTTTWSGMEPMVAIFTFVAMALFTVALPIAYIWFYRSPHVRQTLQVYDPRPRWTDRCPTPVLAVSVWCAVWAWGTLAAALGTFTDFFGAYVFGWPALGLMALKAAMLVGAAVLCFRRNLIGWWLAVACVVFWGTSLVVTHWIADVEAIRPMLEAMESEADARPVVRQATAVLYGIGGILAIGYLLFVRRKFFSDRLTTP